jgi:glycine betaine/proline transport system substrate-binding protein
MEQTEEGCMSKYVRSRRSRLLLPILALALGVVAFMAVGSATAGSKACGTVTLNEQAWAGSTANTYVAKYVLEHKLGCKVNITQIAEIPVYQALAAGKTDAVLEDWQHVDQYKQYITKQHTSVLEGSNGVNGHIFWAIPDYLLKQYPQFKTWKGLKGKESIFKSPESGSQGMFLGGDPSYVQKDQQLIKALGLNFKFVSVGAEAAQVARWSQLVKQHKPVLFYWYTPQYLNVQYKLVEVQLPKPFKGCKDDARGKASDNPNLYKCAYSTYPLNKVFSTKFAKSGSPAVKFLKKWGWSNSDQNTVATWIAGLHMNPDKAAEKWAKANPGKVAKWLS